MGWEPLTRTFCAESAQGDVIFAHTYDATDIASAQRIAARNGWTFLGELIDEVGADDEMIAQMEKNLSRPTIH